MAVPYEENMRKFRRRKSRSNVTFPSRNRVCNYRCMVLFTLWNAWCPLIVTFYTVQLCPQQAPLTSGERLSPRRVWTVYERIFRTKSYCTFSEFCCLGDFITEDSCQVDVSQYTTRIIHVSTAYSWSRYQYFSRSESKDKKPVWIRNANDVT